MFHLRIGDFKTALYYARRCSDIAATVEDSAAKTLSHSILGISLHLNGDLEGARAELEAAVQRGPDVQRTTTIYLGFEGKILAEAILARTLWLQGHPVQAAERARLAVEHAAETDHSLTLCIALIWAITVFLWIGDLEAAEKHIDWLISRSESHSMAPYVAAGHGFKADLAIRQGEAKGGVESLKGSLEKLHSMPYELLTTTLNASLAQGLRAAGRFAEGMALIDETIALVSANGDLKYMPELLRVKGGLLLSMPQPTSDEVEMCFKQSLELSRRQGARAWELRTAVDLAALWAGQGRIESARALLQPVFEQFVEGSDTEDLKAAARLLQTLG